MSDRGTSEEMLVVESPAASGFEPDASDTPTESVVRCRPDVAAVGWRPDDVGASRSSVSDESRRPVGGG